MAGGRRTLRLLALACLLAGTCGQAIAQRGASDPRATANVRPASLAEELPTVAASAAGVEPGAPTAQGATETAAAPAPQGQAPDSAVETAAPPEPPVEVWPEAGPGWEQRKGDAALARIDFPWQGLGYQIKFLPAKQGYRAGTFPDERVIEVYVRPNLTVSETAFDLAHELGHAIDKVRNTAADRAMFQQIRGYARPAWFACNACTDFDTPAGDFAETFAYSRLGAVMFRSRLAPAPTVEQLAAAEALFAA